MAETLPGEEDESLNPKPPKFLQIYGWDLLLGSVAVFYVFMAPYTKVEESFNVQAMHDIVYHQHQLEKYDHLEFPGVVPRTFIGAFLVSILASPLMLGMQFFDVPKLYSLIAVRLVLGCIILSTLRFFRIQVRRIFGYQVEAFFSILTVLQFHFMFYCTRPLPNVLALSFVNLAYGFLLKEKYYATLKCLIFATVVFRCDMLLLLAPVGLQLLLQRKLISLQKALISCTGFGLLCIGLTMMVDTIMWKKVIWPEFEVFWFNSVLNRSSEWGTHAFHWYFTSALPRSLLAAYPLFLLGLILDRRIVCYVLPAFSFVALYSKLPHKELRFIIGAVPMFNLSAAVAAARLYNNRKKRVWKWLYFVMLGSLLISAGCTFITFMASYENYPSGHALKVLHQKAHVTNKVEDQWVHIDTYSAMSGISRFCEDRRPWRYSKEEDISNEELHHRNFTYLLNEHSEIEGFKCLYAENGFFRVCLNFGFPPIILLKEPKVYIHGNMRNQKVIGSNWPGCS